ncbi:MAG: hypothetical protein QXP88_00720, partial [Thermoproteota archaeon]
MVVRVYEYRLASYSYYALVYEKSYADLLADTTFTDANDFITKILDKNFLQTYLFSKLATAISANGGVVDLANQEFDFTIPSEASGEFAAGLGNGQLSQGS